MIRIAQLADSLDTVHVTTVPKQKHIPDNYVRLKPQYCGVCGTDCHFLSKDLICPGHEFSGLVVEVGSEVKDIVPGDRVAVEPIIGCEKCNECVRGYRIICKETKALGFQLQGGMADEVVIPRYTVHKLPENVTFKAASLTEPLAVAVHALRLAGYDTNHEKDDILIIGAGVIGLMIIVGAAHYGFKKISISAKYPYQRDNAIRLGKLLGVDVTTYNDKFEGLTIPPDTIMETVGGRTNTLNDSINQVKPGGRIFLLGGFVGDVKINAWTLLIKLAPIIPSLCYNPNDFQETLQILSKHGDLLSQFFYHTRI
jgi:L-iditol 2-dehydrogenase